MQGTDGSDSFVQGQETFGRGRVGRSETKPADRLRHRRFPSFQLAERGQSLARARRRREPRRRGRNRAPQSGPRTAVPVGPSVHPQLRKSFGFGFQAFGDCFWEFARAELDDVRRLIEKITALGGEPSTEVAELRWTGDPGNAVTWLIESEGDAIANLQAAIEPTGREGRSEALEHMLEHLITRKQEQIDYLMRARRP